MKFNKQLRKSEGQKTTPKVELHINVDGLSIQDPKTKVQQFKFPLHHISYCADDKSEKKLFTFIAKDGTTGKHHCFVLGSEKNAEEITLTIGQAFDLAYKKFIDRQNNQDDKQRQFFLLQQQVTQLQAENKRLRERVAELEGQKSYTTALSGPAGTGTAGTSSAVSVRPTSNGVSSSEQRAQPTELSSLSTPASAAGTSLLDDGSLLSAPSKPFPGSSANGSKENSGSAPPIPVRLAPPPAAVRTHTNGPSTSQQQLMSATADQSAPVASTPATNNESAATGEGHVDAFGMPSFGANELMEIEDMRSGFSRGLSIGVEDFDLSTLDPLSN